MKKITSLLILASLTLAGFAQVSKDNYKNAFTELNQMMNGEIPISFKRAVFVTENAYNENKLDYEKDYLNQINELVRLTKILVAQDGLNYSYKDRQQILLSASIFKIIRDSLVFDIPKQNLTAIKYPFKYDIQDFWGEKDWTKMFVTKLLQTSTGNCHSMPALYKILADELGVNAWLSLAPNHTYIKQWNDKTGWYKYGANYRSISLRC